MSFRRMRPNMVSWIGIKNLKLFQNKHYFVQRGLATSSLTENSTIRLNISELTNQGYGLGRFETPDGNKMVVMVEFALPGETVDCRVTKQNKNYCIAELVSVQHASQYRVAPKCPLFERCGGCQYQHASLEGQHIWKKQQVFDAFTRIGKFSNFVVADVVSSPDSWHYRTKISPRFKRTTGSDGCSTVALGFQQRDSHALIDVEECVIASKPINSHLAYLRSIKDTKHTLFRNDSGVLLIRSGDNESVTHDATAAVTQKVKEYTYRFGANDFFQVNSQLLPLLLDHISQHACSPSGARCHLVDAYCGSGLFSIALASAFKTVVGIELEPSAVDSAKENAKTNNVSNCRFICGKAEDIFSQHHARQATAHGSMPIMHKKGGQLKPAAGTASLLPTAKDAIVLLDPPRNGCAKWFIAHLLAYAPARIIYISCEPTTQARDAALICEGGGYGIANITPFDMFPHTIHVENVIVFDKK